MGKIMRPCLSCGVLTSLGSRCAIHQKMHDALYDKDYRKQAAVMRAAANADPNTICYICKKKAIAGDKWTVDHRYPRDPHSPLDITHSSCNTRKSDKQPTTKEI